MSEPYRCIFVPTNRMCSKTVLMQVQQEALTEQEVALLQQPTVYQPWIDSQSKAQVCMQLD